MTKKSNIPAIRFKNFFDAWEQKKLGEIAQITMGQSPDGATYSETPSTYILIQGNADLKDGWVCPRIWTTAMTKKADAGDLIMSVRAPAGAMGKTQYFAVIGRGVCAIKGNEFIFQTLVKMDTSGNWKTLSCGSTFESLNFEHIAGAVIPIPADPEQQKIGQLFTCLDKSIIQQRRRLEKLKQIKKALLAKMFPQHGADIPEIRFKGFTDAWEQCELKKIGTIQTCKRIFKEQTRPEGEIPFYKNGTLGLQADAFISKELYEKYQKLYPFPKIGNILISVVGSIGRTAEYTGKNEYFQDSNIVWLDTNDAIIDKKFLKISYEIIDWIIEGSTIKHLYNDNILASKIFLTVLDEQYKIGQLFTHLDKLITLHQRRLDKLKQIKKALLAKMFIS